MIDANISIIEDLKFFLQESIKLRFFINGEKSFTKKRKLTFERTVLLILNMLKRSLSIEINEFFETLTLNTSCSKSAFVQQRLKLQHNFFMWWNVVLVESFYRHYHERIKRWQGYRIMAVDGSTAYLINTPELKNCFGTQVNQHTAITMGRIMGIYDILNEITVASHLLPIRYSEKEIINSWIPFYESDMLFLYDRGFPSYTTIYLHMEQEKEIKFVMRCRNNFNKDVALFSAGSKKEKIIELAPSYDAIKELYKHGYIVTKQDKIKIRLIKVILDTGEIEILMTNLMDKKQYPEAIFKKLYFMRWGIETSYGLQKNSLQLESFSGQKAETILQDFYATILLANLQSIISKQCEPDIKLLTEHRKHQYKVNRNVAIGTMKHRIVKLFLEMAPRSMLEELKNIFLRHLEPIRPNRKYDRTNKCRRLKGKYQTLTNYKRAI
jgi:hypothetical protein